MEQAGPEVNEGFDEGGGWGHNRAFMVSSSPRQPSARERRRKLGRRVGIVVFCAIFAGATLLWTIQILTVVWGTAPPSPAGCGPGTSSLELALARARAAYVAGSGAEDERAALSRYRSALQPEWAQEKAVEAACRGEEAGKKRLKHLIALRYAEEHAVRYESLGLAPQRRRLQETNGSAAPSPVGTP